ncbi:MAG: ThuA domain-containing protein [Opitutaceae bacterium]|nr:ThuA domain-containing protein [Opitutaceae bacterium]
MFIRLLLIASLLAASLAAAPAHVVLMIGEDEYKTWESLPAYADSTLRPAGLRVSIVHASKENKNDFPGLATALRDADLLLVSVRRRTPLKEQLDAVRAHVAAGKPVIGIRTASHAFSPLPRETVADARLGTWTTFDAEILGGNYTGHHRGEGMTTIVAAPGASSHPILRSVNLPSLATPVTLYKNTPLVAGATALLIGTFLQHPPEPVAWARTSGPKNARVFYTSLGGPEDFANTHFRRLLLNAVQWALNR